MTSVWAIDDFFVGGEVMSQFNMIYETFDAAPFESDWIFWPGGEIKQFCHMNTEWVSDIDGLVQERQCISSGVTAVLH